MNSVFQMIQKSTLPKKITNNELAINGNNAVNPNMRHKDLIKNRLFNRLWQGIYFIVMASLGATAFAQESIVATGSLDHAMDQPYLRKFKGDSLTYQGLTFLVVEKEEDDDEDYDGDNGYYYTVEESMLGHTNFRLTTAIGTEIGDLPGQIILNKNGLEIYGLELNGGIFNISGQKKPTDNSNIQTLGSLLIRPRFDPGDGFITVENLIRIGDDWFEPFDTAKLNILDSNNALRFLKIRDLSRLGDGDLKLLKLQNAQGKNLIKSEQRLYVNTMGEAVADVALDTKLVLTRDEALGDDNYVSVRSFITRYDIHEGKTLELALLGSEDHRSVSDITGKGNLVLNVKDKRLVLAANQYDWTGTTHLKGDPNFANDVGKVILENRLAQGDLTVENVTLDLNGQNQTLASLTSQNGIIDLNNGHLTVNLTDTDRSHLAGLKGAGSITIVSGNVTAQRNEALSADMRILEDAVIQFNGDNGLGQSNVNLAGKLDLNGTMQTVKTLHIASAGELYNSNKNDLNIAIGHLGAEGSLIENAGKIIVGSRDNHTSGSLLTIKGDYKGLGGSLYMNANINGIGQSSADRLVIQGRAEGQTIVYVNVSGAGGNLGSKDLMLIETHSSTDGAFVAANDIFVGSYQYYLRKEDDQNWYLSADQVETGGTCARSAFTCPWDNEKPNIDEEDKTIDKGGGIFEEENGSKNEQDHPVVDQPGVNRKPKVKPNYRPDIGTNLANTDGAIYSQVPGLGGAGGFGSPIVGAIERHDLGNNIAIWNVTKGSKLYGRALEDTLRFNNEHYSTTFGVDKLFKLDSGASLRFGTMIAIIRSSTHSKNQENDSTSKGRVTGPAFGLYGTWYADDNDRYTPYVDGIISYGRYHNRVETRNNPLATYRSHLWSATVQGGYPLEIGSNMILEPQGQLTYLNYSANEYDYVGGVRVKNSTKGSLVARAGLFAYSKLNNVTPYAGVNIWYDGVKSRTRFNKDLYEGNHKGLSAELKAGISSNMSSKRTTMGVEAFYRKGSKGIKDYGGSFSWRHEL